MAGIMTVREMQGYTREACRTEPEYGGEVLQRLSHPSIARLLHCAIGMVTEAGELIDILKKHIYYGKPLDTVHMIEEIGDSTWYQRIGCDQLEVTFVDTIERNVAKLRARFPERFSQTAALNRDLNSERTELEGTGSYIRAIKRG